jgi:hypothetical protein
VELKIEGLNERLSEATGDSDLAVALCQAAIDLAPEFDGKPAEFGKAVYDLVKQRDPEKKVASGGVFNSVIKIFADSLGESPPGPTSPGDKEPGEGKENSKAGIDSSAKPDTVMVKLSPKIAGYGGAFYDKVTKLWIKGDKPQEVPATLFVKEKIVNGELIEVK